MNDPRPFVRNVAWFADAFGNCVQMNLISRVAAKNFERRFCVFGIVAFFIARAQQRRLRGRDRSFPDQLGGAVLSAIPGVVFVFLVSWLAITAEALRTRPGLEWIPTVDDSRVAALTRSVIERGAEVVLAEAGPGARAAGRAVAHPVQTVERMDELFSNPRVRALSEDRS